MPPNPLRPVTLPQRLATPPDDKCPEAIDSPTRALAMNMPIAAASSSARLSVAGIGAAPVPDAAVQELIAAALSIATRAATPPQPAAEPPRARNAFD